MAICIFVTAPCANGSGYRQWSRETEGMDTNIRRSVSNERKRGGNCIAV